MSEKSKLIELRRKTDRDLLILIRRTLDRGLLLADVAARRESSLYAQAERAYGTVKALLSLVSAGDRAELSELESELQELRTALDRLPSEKMPRHFAAASAE